MNPADLPWNSQETAPGERETWEDLRYDIMEAFDDGDLTREEAVMYVWLLAELFRVPETRTPAHVLAARLCLLHSAKPVC